MKHMATQIKTKADMLKKKTTMTMAGMMQKEEDSFGSDHSSHEDHSCDHEHEEQIKFEDTVMDFLEHRYV